ncbi:NAD(P)H-hydrate epimerase, partial [Coprococcus eutactus]|uniref:NAD(P)H-hydrate epimerase n=1 Tax=Coprococcus eutactus TaxID=33043 RepID=UPI00210F0BC0
LDIVRNLGIQGTDEISQKEYDIIVDGFFGVGLKRDVAGIWKNVIEQMNNMPGYKNAVDLPSGVDATTG